MKSTFTRRGDFHLTLSAYQEHRHFTTLRQATASNLSMCWPSFSLLTFLHIYHHHLASSMPSVGAQHFSFRPPTSIDIHLMYVVLQFFSLHGQIAQRTY
jgi:hypothetical protein